MSSRGWELDKIQAFANSAEQHNVSEVEMLYNTPEIKVSEVLEILHEVYGAEIIQLANGYAYFEKALVTLFGIEECYKNKVVVVSLNDTIFFVTKDPSNTELLERMENIAPEAKLAVADPVEIEKYIETFVRPLYISTISKTVDMPSAQQEVQMFTDVSDSSIHRLIRNLLEMAYENNASDVQIIPEKDVAKIFLRIDGKRVQKTVVDKAALPPLHRILGTLANQQTHDEHKLLQGKFTYSLEDVDLEIRLNIIPTRLGSSMNMRLYIQQDMSIKTITSNTKIQGLFSTITNLTEGLVLFCGPTGSGKSTSMTTIAKELLSHDLNICDVEDPVEQLIPGINQIDISEAKDLTYSTITRSFLRHDPDVLIVGEIRDSEVAKVAMQAADTGHLVLSTLHTKDSISAINRLLDLGVERTTLADNLVAVISQRLLRKLCSACRKKTILKPKAPQRKWLNLQPEEEVTYYEAVGCPECNGTGYNGRFVIYEYMIVTDKVRSIILSNGTYSDIEKSLSESGYSTLLQDALHYLNLGETSLSELVPLITNNQLRKGELLDASW